MRANVQNNEGYVKRRYGFNGEAICIYLQRCVQLQKREGSPPNNSAMPEQPSLQSEQEQCCEVCRQAYFASFEKIQCKECNRIVHRFCYAPDLEDARRFKCDQCRRGREGKCYICGKKNGVLKSMGGSSWTHVLCGLSSPKIRVNSYRALQFSIGPSPQKQTKQRRCFICGHRSEDVFQCWQSSCPNSAHVDCVLSYRFNQGLESYLTFGLLDKHSYALMEHLSHLASKFKSFNFYPVQENPLRMVVCPTHNDDPNFIFCLCGRSKLKGDHKDEVAQVCCDRCKRWFHQECTVVQDFQKDFVCQGCRQNNFFTKCVQLPELIERMGEVELKSQFDREAVRMLDAFIFNLSDVLLELCLKNTQEVDRYYLRRSLEKYGREEMESPRRGRMAKSANRILEIMHLYLKDELKKSGEVSPEDISALLTELANPRGRFSGISVDCLKLYVQLLQSRLSGLTKYDINDIKNGIARFVDRNKQPTRLLSDLVREVREVVRLMDKNDCVRQWLGHKSEPFNLFDFFHRSALTQEQYGEILQNLVRIGTLKREKVVSLTEYSAFINFDRKYANLTDHKRKQLSGIYQKLMRELSIKGPQQEKAERLQQCNTKLQSKALSLEGIVETRQRLIGGGIFLSPVSALVQHENQEMVYEIRKKKLLKLVRNPPIAQIDSIIAEIREMLRVNNEMVTLSDSEMGELMRFEGKFSFFLRVVAFYNKMRGVGELEGKEGSEDWGMLAKLNGTGQGLSELATKAMLNWDKSQQAVNFGFELLDRAAQSGTEFHGTEKQIVSSFAEGILDTITVNYIDNSPKLRPKTLSKACRVIAFIKYEEYYPKLFQWQLQFDEWKRELQSFVDYASVLEDEVRTNVLSELIQAKLGEGEGIPLDVSVEVRKLKILRVWCAVSLKLIAESRGQQKYTINAIQAYKGSLEKLNYPQNSLKRQIDAWDNEYAVLNRRVNRFLEKGKVGEMELHEEMRAMSLKMSLQEAEELRDELQRSALNFQAELVELTAQIDLFKGLPSDLRTHVQSQDKSSVLLQLRRTIADSSLRYQPLEHYYFLLTHIECLKCQQLTGETTYVQYMRMLRYGGTGAVALLSKTGGLYAAYRQIEKAKREFFNNKGSRPEYLLPLDHRKLSQQLRCDPYELQIIEKWYLVVQRAREKMIAYKSLKVEWEKYQDLIYEFQRGPINCSTYIAEILKMRKEAEELAEKAQRYINESVSFDSGICAQIVNRYKTQSIRSQPLQRFQALFKKWRQVRQISLSVTIHNYKQLSLCCEQSIQLTRHVQIKRVRQECFRKMYRFYLDSSLPLMEVGQTLLVEGSFLCRFVEKTGEMLAMMMEINGRIVRTESRLMNYDSDISSISAGGIGSIERNFQSEGEYDLRGQKGSDDGSVSLLDTLLEKRNGELEIGDIGEIMDVGQI